MTTSEINFSPLKNYSTVFLIFRWTKRLRMIALRVLIVGLFVYIFLIKKDFSVSYSGDPLSIAGPLFLSWFVVTFILLISMNSAWQKFGTLNGFSRSMAGMVGRGAMGNVPRQITVPSFRGKRLAISPIPVEGELAGTSFGFFTRLYKEGGVLRWRERQMDTILWMALPKSLPDIVIDATANQRARRSNLSKHYDATWKFQFEGSHGAHYNIYAEPGNRNLTLQLFTPDVLDILYNSLPDVDIEISGATIWFVKRYGVLNPEMAADLFSGVEKLMPELLHQINTAQI